jgi:hypothetical protein
MRHITTAAIILLATSTFALAGNPCPTFSRFGSRSQCAAKPDMGGGVDVRGFDKGWEYSYFATQADPKGNLYGYDARGNYFRYDRATGTYTYFNSTRDWDW